MGIVTGVRRGWFVATRARRRRGPLVPAVLVLNVALVLLAPVFRTSSLGHPDCPGTRRLSAGTTRRLPPMPR